MEIRSTLALSRSVYTILEDRERAVIAVAPALRRN